MAGEAHIFISKDGNLERLVERGYDTEGKLQALLAEHPELLGGEQIDDEAPRRWLLVGCEVGIADDEGASNRWSIDHIFIDQDATPTFVEVKRSSDARIRREVVGQLIEYVANAARFWPPNHLQALANGTATKNSKSLDSIVAALLDTEGDELAAFWARAEQNLREGKVRLMFVADQIPPELRRMAEFLNDQMTNTEVLAVEVRQYVGASGVAALVPFVKNAPAKARGLKEAFRNRRRWTEADFVENLEEIAVPSVRLAAEKVHRELKARATSVSYGSGRLPSFSPRLPGMGPGSPITLKPTGDLAINYGYIGGAFGTLAESSPGLLQRNLLARKFGALLEEIPANERVPRYPSYEGIRWAPHVETLLAALEEIEHLGS